MADGRRLGLTPQLDIEQILREAQHRWLRPAEICEILRNYKNFRIAPEPPNKPINGSLFLFDRKVLRYFRKDGHNWRKKKDGKTVKEAHEKLKAGSVDVLHCYYAHGEDNENFQRRSYWMLEEELMHIVLVHYREVKGGKASYYQQRENGDSLDSPACSNSSVNLSQVPSQVSDYGSPNSTQQSEYEDADSDNYQASSRYHSLPKVQQYGSWMNVPLSNASAPAPILHDQSDYQRLQAAIPDFKSFTAAQDSMINVENLPDVGLTYAGSSTKTNMASWHEIMESSSIGFQTPFDLSVSSVWAATLEDNPERNSFMIQDFLTGDISTYKEDGATLSSNIAWQFSDKEAGSLPTSGNIVENSPATEENLNNLSETSNKESEGLKKYDSFSRWMSNELGEVDNSQINSNSGIYWSSLESESVVADSNLLNQEQPDAYLMGPSLSQDQLFSIIDFSPNWAHTDLVTKVIVKGRFLMNEEDLQKHKWSCMFGEIEVPADIMEDGTLCCHTPPHKPGRVPFYISCSNRVACSEIREFEYKLDPSRSAGADDLSSSTTLQSRFENLLLLDSVECLIPDCDHPNERSRTDCTICSLIMENDDEVIDLFKHDEDILHVASKNRVLESQLKLKLHMWLLHKVGEGDGKGPNVLDREGQGVLHLAAALGYDWAIKPTVAAGVNINFRDVHGWTALHWAAFCGQERTVVTLLALDASPGALTDPTPEFPTGRTPADLASQNGHKGIAGFLAESSLTNHLRALTLKESENHNSSKPYGLLGFENVPDKINVQLTEGEIQTSLRAVRNATEAAARIFQVFRVQSFNRKKMIERSDEKCGISDGRALSQISRKPYKSAQPYKSTQPDTPVHAAAIKIQNKFRGWKGRKEFLITRQRIVKIQAHVRGHQVRKHYKKIIWSVGIVEKVILRWRRKGSGLRGFRSDGLIEGQKALNMPNKEDDYDFLHVGRKQNEARLEKALARVKSMVQYPEARDQYKRLVTVVTKLQESKLMPSDAPNDLGGPSDSDFMMELEGLIGDCDVMPALS